MQQLSKCQRHQHPAPKPRRHPAQPPIRFQGVVRKLGGSRRDVDGGRQAKLFARIQAQAEAGQACRHRGREPREEQVGDARVAPSEGHGVARLQGLAQAGEEAVERAVEEEDGGEGEGEAEVE